MLKGRVVVLGPDASLPSQHCLACRAPIDAGFGFGNAERPKEGAVVMCAKCSHLQIINHIGKFREPTVDELTYIMQDENVQLAITVNQRVNAKKKGEPDAGP